MSDELAYALLILALFVVPVLLRRFSIPSGLTSLALGMAAAPLGWFDHDQTVTLLSTFGIVALFLSAGLHVSVRELQANTRPIVIYLVLVLALVCLAVLGLSTWLGLAPRPAWLLALAVLVPSTGFILDALPGLGMEVGERDLTRALGVGAELVGLAALFLVTQSTSAQTLGIALLALIGLVAAVPFVLRGFATFVSTHAPNTEFAFLLVLGFICAFVTRQLGVYYLVGAFLVGFAARRFRERLPALSSERMLNGLEDFGKLFAPFYFFHAGQGIDLASLGIRDVVFALVVAAVVLPLRIGVAALAVRFGFRTVATQRGTVVGTALLPTLVFSLVLIGLVRDRFDVPPEVLNVALLYTLVSTAVPAFALRLSRATPVGNVPEPASLDAFAGPEPDR